MATAKDKSAEQRLADLEKATVDYLDLFIATRGIENEGSCQVPMVSFQGWVGGTGPKDIRDYVGHRMKEIEDYISVRTHLWQVSASKNSSTLKMLMVERQPPQLRAALLRMLVYVQQKCQQGGAAKLGNISCQLGQHFPSIKRELGTGLDYVKAFLLSFPALFTMLPFDPECKELTEIPFKNRATVVNNVVLLSTKEGQPNPSRLDGCGPVVKLYPSYGFIRDFNSNEEAFFIVQIYRGTVEEFRRLAADGNQFSFKAFVSTEYDAGKTKSKWCVTDMWLAAESKSGATAKKAEKKLTNATEGKAGGPAEKEKLEGKKVETNSTNASAAATAKNAKAVNKEKIAQDQKAAGNSEPGGAKKKTGVTPAKAHGSKKEAPDDFMMVLNEELDVAGALNKENRKSPFPGQNEVSSEYYQRLAKLENLTAILEQQLQMQFPSAFAEYNTDSRDSAAPRKTTGSSAGSRKESPMPSGPLVSQNAVSIDANKTSLKVAQELKEKSPNSRPYSPALSQSSSHARPEAKRNLVHKQEVGCQTEFNDERELLLRLLRRSPDLLKLVRAVREPDT